MQALSACDDKHTKRCIVCLINIVSSTHVRLANPTFGLQLALVLGMVTGIHFVEAYLLNPAIYAAHLQLHPLLVLSVLVVAEHSLGVWGLLLAGTSLFLSSTLMSLTGLLLQA